MRKVLFFLFIALGSVYLFLDSKWGKKALKGWVSSAFARSGWELQIGSLEGGFPGEARLKNLRVNIPEVGLLEAEELHLKMRVLPLFKKEFAFDFIKAKNLVWQGQKGAMRRIKKPPFSLSVDQFTIQNGKFLEDFWGDFEGKFEWRGLLFLESKAVTNKGKGEGWYLIRRSRFSQAKLNWDAGDLKFLLYARGEELTSGTLKGSYREKTFKGLLKRNGEEVTFTGEADRLTGQIRVAPTEKGWKGNLDAAIQANPYVSHIEAEGVWQEESASGRTTVQGRLGRERVELISDFEWSNRRLTLPDLDLQSPHLRITGTASWDGEVAADLDFQLYNLHPIVPDWYGSAQGRLEIGERPLLNLRTTGLQYGDFATSRLDLVLEENRFHLHAVRGEDLLFTDGSYVFYNQKLTCQIDHLHGQVNQKALLLEEPVSLALEKEELSLSPTRLSWGEATAQAEYQRGEGTFRFEDKDLLFSLELAPSELNARLFTSVGTVQAHTSSGLLNVKGDLGEPFQIDASIPFAFQIWPYKLDYDLSKARGTIAYQGPIQDLLDRYDIGPHRLEGMLNLDLSIGSSLQGTFSFSEGTYENYYTGTLLTAINASGDAVGQTLRLLLFSAENGGKLTARGAIDLTPAFPYRFELDFHRLSCLAIDWANAEASGSLVIQGDRKEGRLEGEVIVQESEITIPDRIIKPLPKLDVRYINGAPPPLPFLTLHDNPYPLFLNLHLHAPSAVTISGRGLSSQWKGDVGLQGTYTDVEAKGKLELLSGQFLFSSRSFKLTEGTLTFRGQSREVPFLNLEGEMLEQGILIGARLHGPITSPLLTFSSNPPLPKASILSYLLFGQDVSEINAFQALSLANSLATLSGESPDLLESTRRSLGVDRLRIITSPGDDTVALQVGKYVATGVIVSLSQTPDQAVPSIAVEVDLKHGFLFEAESDQIQEQGRFSIKWNRSF
jgi:hypothetical protein